MAGQRALIVGWRGGVGRALLGLLAGHAAGHRRLGQLAELFLLDQDSGGPPPLDAQVLAPAPLETVLGHHRIDQVIEVADVETMAFSASCARHGADYVSASVQHRELSTMEGARALAVPPTLRPDVGARSHLLATGMNPGIVNALVLAGIEALVERTGLAADALELCAIHVTEEDTTAPSAAPAPDVFPMSWSPAHALDEILEPAAMYVAQGRFARLPHRPHERLYAARCGTREIAAMVVPHEELVSIGWRFPGVESAFFYAVPPVARAALERHPDRRADQWRTRRMYPPYETQLTGRDRVGVLLATRRLGELWIGFDNDVGDGARFGTNATLLQAAAGVLAGWALLGTRRGVHSVEELDWRAYLAIAEEILGAPEIHYAPDARPRPLAERRV
jgi:hypothetical protein